MSAPAAYGVEVCAGCSAQRASWPLLRPETHPASLSLPSRSSYSQPNVDGEIGTAAKTLQRRMRDIENEGRVFDASAPYVKVS